MSYTEFGERAAWFGRGLRELGLSPGDRVVVFAETRAEWLMSALAAFLHNITGETRLLVVGRRVWCDFRTTW